MDFPNHRVRCAALITEGERLLLVLHVDPRTGQAFWLPPGGGIDGDESFFACAQREVFEETGLTVELDRIVYLCQYLDPDHAANTTEVFIRATSYSGDVTIENVVGNGADEDWIKEARFISREETAGLTVYPEHVMDVFWDDLAAGFPQVRYLGIHGPGTD